MKIRTLGIGAPQMTLHGKPHQITWGNTHVKVHDGKDEKASIDNAKMARMLGAMPLQTFLEKEIVRQA